jgi:hypothetical protein
VTAILSLSVVGYGSTAYGFSSDYPVTCTTQTADASAATVQAAIDAAARGSVVCVAAGTESWKITGGVKIDRNKNIVLAGAAAWGGGTTTINTGSPVMSSTSAHGKARVSPASFNFEGILHPILAPRATALTTTY